MTTYAAFLSTISGLDITGVVRALGYEPLAGYTGDLPMSFVRLPNGGTNPETSTTCSGDGKSRACDLVVILEPSGQGTPALNFAATVAMMDNVETALDGLGDTMPMTEYSIRAEGVAVGDAVHWGVIATITGIE